MTESTDKRAAQCPAGEDIPRRKRTLRGRIRHLWESLFGRHGETMPDGGRFISLRVRFASILVFSIVAILIGYLLIVPLSIQIVHGVYMRPEHVNERLDRYIGSFSAYVERENVESTNTAAVLKWTQRHRSVFLTVSAAEGNEGFGASGGELLPDGESPDMDPLMSNAAIYPVRFANGTRSVTVVDYSYNHLLNGIIFGGMFAALLLFFIIMMAYYHRQTNAIVALSKEVEKVSSGDWDGQIRSERNDEIGRLALDVDTMRDTILDKMAQQERAWQANSDLLTSMTHDIRTPLTTLLGYMELLAADTENITDEQREYLRVCMTKTAQIKGLSDKLFLYFWAYNRSEMDVEIGTYEAAILLEQLIGEYIPTLSTAGLEVHSDLGVLTPDDRIRVSVDCLRRVTDNLCDNICKYADRSVPIEIRAERGDHDLRVYFSNGIGEPVPAASSTRVGVKTCINMMELMHGSFSAERTDSTYVTCLTLPLYDGE